MKDEAIYSLLVNLKDTPTQGVLVSSIRGGYVGLYEFKITENEDGEADYSTVSLTEDEGQKKLNEIFAKSCDDHTSFEVNTMYHCDSELWKENEDLIEGFRTLNHLQNNRLSNKEILMKTLKSWATAAGYELVQYLAYNYHGDEKRALENWELMIDKLAATGYSPLEPDSQDAIREIIEEDYLKRSDE